MSETPRPTAAIALPGVMDSDAPSLVERLGAREVADRVRQTAGDQTSGLPRLFTLPEVAAALSVSPKTVRRLLGRGFPCVRVGRSVRFEPQAVVRWLTARREGAQGA